ncbi:MAG: hypothetical protein AAFX06_09100 [Planctomycetota bacterium]
MVPAAPTGAAAGAGGIAVGAHSTQFEIRDPTHGLVEPLLNQSIDVARRYAAADFVLIAGICGRSAQATLEAELAKIWDTTQAC